MKVLILGANGFIGSTLVERILTNQKAYPWTIYACDLVDHHLTSFHDHPSFHFSKVDMTKDHDWVKEHIEKCDVVLPLVAIANPSIYVNNPLKIFELDFEANLAVVRYCVEAKKRIIFPSTSEVYGMCPDEYFDEETSSLVLGPISKQRWIYSCSKQMLDRVIYAYGQRDGLDYTLFRPFNWAGPKLDNIFNKNAGGSRVLTQFMSDVWHHQTITLVDGGKQKRCFTDIDDGIDGLLAMIDNQNNCASGQIFNLGNPDNEYSIEELAHFLLDTLKESDVFKDKAMATQIVNKNGSEYYGKSYQDMARRVPSIEKAKSLLGWKPTRSLKETLTKTIQYYEKII